MSGTDLYKQLLNQHNEELSRINKKYNFLGTVRLVTGLGIALFFYFFLTTYQNIFLFLTIGSFTLFLFLIRVHLNLVAKRKVQKALVEINENEIQYLNQEAIPFENGQEFIQPHHEFSYDLDLFGPKSLYHILNRSTSYTGKHKLAEFLLELKPVKEIENRQKAVEELQPQVEFRQKIAALGKAKPDSKEIVDDLKEWSQSEIAEVPKWLIPLAYFLPLVFATFFVLFLFDNSLPWGKLVTLVGIINITLVFNQLKKVKKELLSSTKIDEILTNYSILIQEIESKTFQSEKLKSLQDHLDHNQLKASQHIHKLSKLFGQLENIQNPLGAFIINGIMLYHIHTMKSLAKWKRENASQITNWLELIGEFEALSSLANFSYNNPNYSFPMLNQDEIISFQNLGHPLINDQVRVNNDISFDGFRFIILTGSNMSGKSTFLRSVGINLILARSGSVICANEANVHPMQILVSMRLSDSLSDNESYFFAEVKRLKEIMEKSTTQASFVLLDEILRGTNSDDKREGTIEVIKKIIQKPVYGAIATHDLKVCEITRDYPGILSNKNFEVEIQNDELYFDYKLREGICKNKSATFLMKKMDVI